MKDNRFQAAAYTSLLIAMVLWASTFVALKLAFRAYDPMVVIFGRMLIASLCALFVPFVFKAIKKVRKEDIKFILLMAFCEPCLYFIFEAKALVYTSASQAGIITAMMPLMTAFGAWFFLKETLSFKICIGFGVAATGAVWLTLASPPTPHGPNPMLGNFLEFLAMACASGYGLCCKRLTNRNYNPFFLAFTQCFIGAIFYFPLLFLPGTELPTMVDPVSLSAVVYLGVVVTVGAYGLYNFGVSRIPASQAGAFANLIPVISLVLSALVLGERFTAVQYLASSVVLAGVILTQDIRRQKAIHPPHPIIEKQ
ncbi:MAG TPA: EamA family transporter [Desulfobacteraceae bacterium]|nr:EamA family transporter [Desulfobacteraceae bacterium]